MVTVEHKGSAHTHTHTHTHNDVPVYTTPRRVFLYTHKHHDVNARLPEAADVKDSRAGVDAELR